MSNQNKGTQSTNTVDTDKDDDNYQTLLIGEAAKLSTKSTGKLGFEIALNVKAKLKFLRITNNPSGGLFTRSWVSIIDIVELLEKQEEGKAFKSSTFQPLLSGGSSNNVSFLSSILRSPLIGFIKPSPNSLFLHVVNPDLAKQVAIIEKLTSIDDKAAVNNKVKSTNTKVAKNN